MQRGIIGKTRIFAKRELGEYIEERRQVILSSIDNERDDYLLNVNEEDYLQYKESEAIIEPLEIYVDDIYVSSTEQMIPAKYFSHAFNIYPGKSYKKDVIKFHIPFSGNPDLLICCPSARLMWSIDVNIGPEEFTFEIINFRDDAEEIRREKDSNLNNIMKQFNNIKNEVEQFNLNIRTQIKITFEARKQRIIKKSGVLASLGVPIKKVSAASTFSVPSIQKKKKIVFCKPEVFEKGYKPEPTLDSHVYNDILRLIHDVGKEFERLPSLYANKEEEHLRDHFLMMLEPNFQGSATGETFNKTGKTDILLRYEGTNVFIGECKFWKGIKGFHHTITQLLGYLTWRDSKAAIIIFVQNKDFSSVIKIVKDKIGEHPNFLRMTDEIDETWMNCEFHLNGDRNRIVKVASMIYHIPKQ